MAVIIEMKNLIISNERTKMISFIVNKTTSVHDNISNTVNSVFF